MTPIYFDSADAFGAWLEAHHAREAEVWVGFWKAGTGQPTLTWPESVDQALRFGWIDGVRRSVDEHRYAIRFTPRKRGSTWSVVNLRKVDALIAGGRMHAAGLAAYESRDAAKTARYSFERAHAALDAAQERRFRASPAAWAWFSSQPPGYRKLALHWVTSARRQDTRDRRLATLIADSAAHRRIGLLGRDRS